MSAVAPKAFGPRNAGAHRLAWWLAAGRDGARYAMLAAGAALDLGDIDRLLSGELVPAEAVAARVAQATEGDVLPDDWERPADGGWDARPARREGAGR